MELTLPGFRHDMCSTILPLTLASPFFTSIDLAARGVEIVHPDVPVAHPLDGGRAAVLDRSVAITGEGLGGADGRAWRRLFGPLVREVAKIGPRDPPTGAAHPPPPAGSGPVRPAGAALAQKDWPASRFRDDPARALFAGIAAHAMLRLDRPLSASFGLVLATYAHAVGWPMTRGGASAVTNALVAELEAAGGEVVTNHRVTSLADLPAARAVLFDVTPRQLVAIAGDRLPSHVTPARERDSATARACSSSTGRWMDPCRGRPKGRAAQPRSISAARSTRSRRRRRTSPPAATPIGRTCCSCSTRRGTPRAHRRARRPRGRTATCPRARTWT